MSDHADTIRRYLLWKQALSVYDATQHKHLIDNDVPQPTIEEALEALDALLAERQQAQKERDTAQLQYEQAREREQRLVKDIAEVRVQRQQAIDALREIAKTEDSFQAQSCYTGTVATAHHDCPSLARAALVKLGEQP